MGHLDHIKSNFFFDTQPGQFTRRSHGSGSGGGSSDNARAFGKRHPEDRWRMFAEAWKASRFPDANLFVTVNFPREDLDAFLAETGKTVSSFRAPIMDEIRRKVIKHCTIWLSMWVIETDNHPHFHTLIHVDDDVIEPFTSDMAAWAKRKFAWNELTEEQARRKIWERENGLDVQVTQIDPDRIHQASGLPGFDGLIEYLAKEIAPNDARTRGRRLGKLVGASGPILREARKSQLDGSDIDRRRQTDRPGGHPRGRHRDKKRRRR